jgi:hypothetical protein
MPSNDLEEELLRRFQALKTPPTTTPRTIVTPTFKGISDEQAKKAKEEDDELERIAEGRPSRVDIDAKGNGNGAMEDDLARRMAKLKGVEYDLEVDDDDQEVRVRYRRGLTD